MSKLFMLTDSSSLNDSAMETYRKRHVYVYKSTPQGLK